MDGFMTALVTGVAIVVVAFGVVLVVRNKIKKDTEGSNKPSEIAEQEMQDLIAKAKADMEKEKKEEGDGDGDNING